jgi:hypothetical protein
MLKNYLLVFAIIVIAAAIQGAVAGSMISLVAGGVLGGLILAGALMLGSESNAGADPRARRRIGHRGKIHPGVFQEGTCHLACGDSRAARSHRPRLDHRDFGTEVVAVRVGGAILAGLCLGLLTGCPRPTGPAPRVDVPATPTPEPKPTPPPAPFVPNKRLEIGKIFNGMQYKVNFETENGTTATHDRAESDSYVAELTVKVKVPKPHQSLAELSQLNPKLPDLLPVLPQLIEKANVSPYFDELYRLKVEQVKSNVKRLDTVLTKHNFYDCETILELQHPETKRRALLIQADMDVDEDGSDSDRIPVVDGSSLTFQPFTSYRWPKKSENPNPFLAQREQALTKAKDDAAKPGLTAERTKALKQTIADIESDIYSLKKYSFLVGRSRPVHRASVVRRGKEVAVLRCHGDYCVVIHDGVLYPAIVGDVGPGYKMGEASLRICKEINKRSNSMNRPVSDLKVTYLVFPGTSEKPFGVPDLTRWHDRCAKYIDELGGAHGELFVWADLTAPPPPQPPVHAPHRAQHPRQVHPHPRWVQPPHPLPVRQMRYPRRPLPLLRPRVRRRQHRAQAHRSPHHRMSEI